MMDNYTRTLNKIYIFSKEMLKLSIDIELGMFKKGLCMQYGS